MRDLMSLAERPEIISLAGGLPQHRVVRARGVRRGRGGHRPRPPGRGAPVRAHRGPGRAARADRGHHGPRGRAHAGVEDIMVTSGGQQAIDLSIRTFVNPGDTVLAEGPTYPGAVPCFTTYEARVEHIPMDEDGLRVDLVEEVARPARPPRAAPPKLLYTIPNFHNPGRRDDVAGAPRAAGRDRPRARAADRGGQPLRPDPLRGGAAAHAVGARRRRRAGSSTSPPSPRSSRRACAWAGSRRRAAVLRKMNLGKQAADLCSSTISQRFVLEYLRRYDWRDYVARLNVIYRSRRDAHAARAGGGDAPRGHLDPPVRRAVRLGDPARLPRHHQPARVGGRQARGGLRARPRRVPGRPRRRRHAPQLLGRARADDQRGRAPPGGRGGRDDRAPPRARRRAA